MSEQIKDGGAAAQGEAVAWQIFGMLSEWESISKEQYEKSLATGRYLGLYSGTKDFRVRALCVVPSDHEAASTTVESVVPRENLLWPAVDRMLVDAWHLGRDEGEMDMLAMRMRFRAIFAAREAKS